MAPVVARFPLVLGGLAHFTNREGECASLRGLVEAVQRGESRVLVMHGEPGVGKTALLEYLVGEARDCRVVRAGGVQSEMELPFAGLHQLCAPLLPHLELLPGPQCDALRTTFGISPGAAPDRLLLGLAVLGLLSDAAEKRPLLCVVDDTQWLDGASAQVLGFVARRLGAEALGLVFAVRVPSQQLVGLPQLEIEGLAEHDARTLLDSALTAPLDGRVRDQIVAETGGNPLALLELPRGLTPSELAGGFGLPGSIPLSSSIEESFQRRSEALPAESRRLLLLAAAEPLGDPVLLWQAAGRLGIGAAAAVPATEADLVKFGHRVRFHHPLVRSAVYQSASAEERQQVHRVLAEVTDPDVDPDRRAWHRAQAAVGPDEEVAGELERSASRAQARGGLAAAAAFLDQATLFTPDPAPRARRAVAAAQAKVEAGAFGAARDLLALAEAGPLSELERARVDLVRAQLAFAISRGRDAPLLLVTAAERLEAIDAGLARATYRDAMIAALFAGRFATPASDVRAVARIAGAVGPPNDSPTATDLLLDGLAATFNQGYAAGLPMLRAALAGFGRGMPPEQELGWLPLAYVASMHTRNEERWMALSERWAKLARDRGALGDLPLALTARVQVLLVAGELTAAASLVEEVQACIEATGSHFPAYGAMCLAAFRGDEIKASILIQDTIQDASERGEGLGISAAEWANAVLNNGFGRYHEAMSAAQRAAEDVRGVGFSNWALVELIEAAAHCGREDTAAQAHHRLIAITGVSGTDWAIGVEARSNALLTEGDEAERLYRESIARLGRTRVLSELARTHLLYGEWLRRRHRPGEARIQLRTAHNMLVAIGMDAFAERARRELLATGESARKRRVDTSGQLTAQETVIARLAGQGLSNPEIGARLFISARTVQYHLSKVFTKLDITSRNQLPRVPG